jgi:hypothetical protein
MKQYKFIPIAGWLLYNLFSSSVWAQPVAENTLSLGAVRDITEKAVVRLMVKHAEAWNADDKLVQRKTLVAGRETFYTTSRKAELNVTENGTFDGVILRYGVRAYSVNNELDKVLTQANDGKPVISIDSDSWIHVFPVEIGFDADENFNNRDALLEVAYVPLLLSDGNCFKLGANPIIGISAQMGQQTRDSNSAALAGQQTGTSGTLRRMKLDAKLDIPFTCLIRPSGNPATIDASSILSVLGSDISQLGSFLSDWTLSTSATGWRDFSDDRSYKKYEAVLRIPTGEKSTLDLKRELGAAPTAFDTGAKFSANLTLAF